MYEDLVSEGILACYEAKAKGKENPAHLFRQAKTTNVQLPKSQEQRNLIAII